MFMPGTNTVAGVTVLNIEILTTPVLRLTAGDDIFTVTGIGTGMFNGRTYSGLTGVDGLGGNDTIVLTAGEMLPQAV